MEMHEKVARQIAEWACISDAWEEYLPKADALLALFAEDRRDLVKALRMARADLMAWASHDAMDDRDAVQARYANTPAIRAIDAVLAKEGVGG